MWIAPEGHYGNMLAPFELILLARPLAQEVKIPSDTVQLHQSHVKWVYFY